MARLRSIVVLAAAAALVLSACSGGEDPESTSRGSLTFLFPTGPVDMDPSTSQDNNVAMPMWSAWFEGLIAAQPDSPEFSPVLASTWDVSDDGLIYTFTLDDRATFSDGAPVTADDVVFSLERDMAPEISLLNFLLAKIDSITATDASTVTISLLEPWPHLLADLASPTAVVYSKAVLEAADEQTFFNEAPVGSGPFTLSEVTPS